MRTGERVMPLELFFDLVFVLALTQCTALMADKPTWEGLAQGLLVLGVLWWCWVGYSWLTSVVDPEEGVVRFAIFGAMAGLLVAALCVPEAFDDRALLFAVCYAVVRVGQIVLFMAASRDDPGLRRSVVGLAGRHGARRWGCCSRRARHGRRAAGRDLGGGDPARHGRAVLLRLGGLEARCRATSRSATA